MKVSWHGVTSNSRKLNGGGLLGGLLGILENLSKTNGNTEFWTDVVKFKFIDDISVLEIVNILNQWDIIL